MSISNFPFLQGLIGLKIGMTRIFSEDGFSIPVTLINFSRNYISNIKKLKKDGYESAQISFSFKKKSRISKPNSGHLSKYKIENSNILKEFKIFKSKINNNLNINLGSIIPVCSVFKEKQLVDITGTTIGKGFAGSIKRNHFKSQKASHGNSLSHRAPGSIGQCQDPGKVFKGKKMTGHLGSSKRTLKNLKIVRIYKKENLVMVRGSVPGYNGSFLFTKHSLKLKY